VSTPDFTLKPVEYNDVPDPGNPSAISLYQETMALKKVNPDLKVLIAVGGW
jgi:GH18 family chitinase